jgi:hypothetical protein
MSAADLDRELDRLERNLTPRLARFLRWVRQPSARWVRWPLALVLMAGGIVGFLPVLGLWMLPLGLVLIAQDIPGLRGPMARLVAWINDRWLRDRNAAPAERRQR